MQPCAILIETVFQVDIHRAEEGVLCAEEDP